MKGDLADAVIGGQPFDGPGIHRGQEQGLAEHIGDGGARDETQPD